MSRGSVPWGYVHHGHAWTVRASVRYALAIWLASVALLPLAMAFR